MWTFFERKQIGSCNMDNDLQAIPTLSFLHCSSSFDIFFATKQTCREVYMPSEREWSCVLLWTDYNSQCVCLCVCIVREPTSFSQSTTQWRTNAAPEATWPWIPDRDSRRDQATPRSVHIPSEGWTALHEDTPGRTHTDGWDYNCAPPHWLLMHSPSVKHMNWDFPS